MVRWASKLVALIILICVGGCKSSLPINQGEIRSKCREFAAICDPTCTERKFSACYIDSKMFPVAPHEVFKHCYGVHAGNTCVPCEQIFSVSFGGAMRNVGCEEFMRSLAVKNQQCGDCLKMYGDGPE